MARGLGGLVCVVLVACASGKSGTTAHNASWSFDEDTSGLPAGWRAGESHGVGSSATWEVVSRDDAPSAPHAFGVTSSKNTGSTFNVALGEAGPFGDLDLSVAVHAVSGAEDQGGGPVWRARNFSNYYVTRWNPLEDNFRVYVVEEDRRTELGSATVKAEAEAWHTVRVVMVGAQIDCYFDGEKLLSVKDKTFKEAGSVGLWSKADAATLFDDVHVQAVNP